MNFWAILYVEKLISFQPSESELLPLHETVEPANAV